MFTSKQALLLVTEVLCVTPPFPFQLRHAVGVAFVPQLLNKQQRAHLDLSTQELICEV